MKVDIPLKKDKNQPNQKIEPGLIFNEIMGFIFLRKQHGWLFITNVEFYMADLSRYI